MRTRDGPGSEPESDDDLHGLVYAVTGRREEAEALAAEHPDAAARQMLIYAGLGDKDGAFKALEAYSESLYPARFGWSPLRALRDGRFKLIDAPRRELYDLERDPFEEHNLYENRRELGDALARRLGDFSGAASASVGDVASTERQQRLAALGYVGASPTPRPALAERLPDPKDCIGLVKAWRGAAAADSTRCQ